MKTFFFLAAFLMVIGNAKAQYNTCAGQNAPTVAVEKVVVDQSTGERKVVVEQQKVKSDNFGNADGNKFDLAVDGAFDGQTIVVMHLYTGEGFDFELPKKALAEKGFSVYRYINVAPDAKTLKEALSKACQFWLISGTTQQLTPEHVKVIKEFWDAGHGVYIWGDNDPYHADANYLAKELVGASMEGYYMGNQVVTLKSDSTVSGLQRDHLITTGLEYVYEGITISKIHDNKNWLTPLIWSTDGNVVASVYEKDGKRLIIDGGFTRLYVNWDTAGTGRYVKNAAAWLVNFEKFGNAVVSDAVKKSKSKTN